MQPLAAPAPGRTRDRKSTRLNSSHRTISYAVFCLKKKNKEWTDLLLQKKTAQRARLARSKYLWIVKGASGVVSTRPNPACLPFFFFNDPATTEIYTLSLHDALPI